MKQCFKGVTMIGERVFVYRNLHKKCYSVKSLKTGRVIAHVDSIDLVNFSFRVSKAGRERVLREKRKNVHAGVVGYVSCPVNKAYSTDVTYNPYKYNSFVLKNNEVPVFNADIAHIDLSGIKI
jgi:hypothetical protein